jgi:hypothetical protein
MTGTVLSLSKIEGNEPWGGAGKLAIAGRGDGHARVRELIFFFIIVRVAWWRRRLGAVFSTFITFVLKDGHYCLVGLPFFLTSSRHSVCIQE